ncbi:hypothetical protein ACFWOG_39565 [Kitasatospora sp. NPDC058406]|uniref:hypothetical protein n=1 Tax=Kitasatospora sp. NPDC058406 TaxID=3346483 RepID=UPI00365F47FD
MSYSAPQEFGELTFVFSAGETKPPAGYHALCSVIPKDGPMTWVKETTPGSGALAKPKDWRKVTDSDRVLRGLVPVVPEGYRALSALWSSDRIHKAHDILLDLRGQAFVAQDDLRCVKEEIGGRSYVAVGAWRGHGGLEIPETIRPKVVPEGAGCLLTPGIATWIYYFDGDYEGEDPGDVYVLDVPMKQVKQGKLEDPVIGGWDDVPEQTTPVIDREVVVPCIAVVDKGKSTDWIVQNSPAYTVRRKRFYTRQAVLNLRQNPRDGSVTDSVSWGVSKTASETYRESVGMSVGFEAGVEVEGFSAKVTASLSRELGYESTHSVTTMAQESKVVSAPAPGLHLTALYSESHCIEVVRNDPNHTLASGQEGLTFQANAYYVAPTYPSPQD